MDGGKRVELLYEGIFEEVLDRAGQMPLPPYITERLADKERYQTVYAVTRGSAAAPTAGLHFTQELLQQIADKGVKIVDVLLGCTSRRSCWSASGRRASTSCRCCCTWVWAPSAR